MKKSKYSDSQIVSILKEAEAGGPVKQICRKSGISSACGSCGAPMACVGSSSKPL